MSELPEGGRPGSVEICPCNYPTRKKKQATSLKYYKVVQVSSLEQMEQTMNDFVHEYNYVEWSIDMINGETAIIVVASQPRLRLKEDYS